jgi:hypothetical protein
MGNDTYRGMKEKVKVAQDARAGVTNPVGSSLAMVWVSSHGKAALKKSSPTSKRCANKPDVTRYANTAVSASVTLYSHPGYFFLSSLSGKRQLFEAAI